jgi:hypothetical protein
VLADALGEAARVMRVLEDWTAVRLWLIVTLVAGCGAAEVTEPVFALVGGASGDSPRSCSSRSRHGSVGSRSTACCYTASMTPEDAYDWYPLRQRVGVSETSDAGPISLAEGSKLSFTVVGAEDGIDYEIPPEVVEALDSVPPGDLYERINAAARVAAERR